MEQQRAELLRRLQRIRATTEALAAPLSAEDQQLQSMPLASPTKWHRAHTTWFWETFVLGPLGEPPYDPRFGFLFNSYYDAVGERVARDLRGLLSRPSATEVGRYRAAVDEQLQRRLGALEPQAFAALVPLLELGLAHEEQHQELLLTDALHALSQSPLGPVYREGEPPRAQAPAARGWRSFEGGRFEMGARDAGFAFDNERPRHTVWLQDFSLATTVVTVGELRAFLRDGGYRTPSLWLSEGWARARAEGWRAPLYTEVEGDELRHFTLRGWRTPDDAEPAGHLSFWEAEAIARWLGARLPTEAEWERAAQAVPAELGNFADGPLVPRPAEGDGIVQLFGDVWEWTRSSYAPYPGFAAAAGAVGEYNGKFMAQQFVLRGGSCLSPRGHLRATYRNFWHPETRFQQAGVRLARDA